MRMRPYPAPADGVLQILGAAYGLVDVTSIVTYLLKDNGLQLIANDATLGKPSGDVVTTFTVVYRYGSGPPKLKTCLKSQPIKILPSAELRLERR